ncbi:MAG: four-carbon acid sugar kinase family protein [Thermomicrobiales bacterium]|nr:four-carbon acid sugar kinase family protein [Thermomicrobiales bacterium]
MTHLVIIADDLTGAADAAGVFATLGFSTAIPLDDGALPDADVISISTGSRDLDEHAATVAVSAAARRIAALPEPPGLIYKKLDSALRGHLRAELLTAMAALGHRRAIVCPALPVEGRTTVGGRQYVHGVPLERSSFGGPGVTSDLVEIFAGTGGPPPVATIGLDALRSPAQPDRVPREGIIAIDAERDGDLDQIVCLAAAAQVRLLAGSAGLAHAIARAGIGRPTKAPPPWRPAGGRPILMIVGTRHAATARQIERAEAAGVKIFRPEQACLDNAEVPLGEALHGVEAALARGDSVILTSAGLLRSPRGAAAVAARLASVLQSSRVRASIGGLVLTGGDVAAAACRALGASALWLRGEVRTALPWSTLAGGLLPGLPMVTKAGSFGDDEALIAAASRIAQTGR